MSVSRSSIARTRDKRVPKIPARFDDFSEIPPSTYLRNYLRESQKNIENTSTSPFHPSITFLTNTSTSSDTLKEHQQTIRIHPVDDESPEPETDPEPRASSATSRSPDLVQPPTASQSPSPLPAAQAKITNTNINNDKSASSPPPTKKTKKEISNPIAAKPNVFVSTTAPNKAIDLTPSRPAPATMSLPSITKLYSGAKYTTTANMQYGTRLMLNEPIYLPRSVATIAPITTTYEQIVNLSRKIPFMSKRTEAYLNYQDDRKLNYILSLNQSLTRIAEQLETKDLINLRAVSRAWRTVVDNGALWQRVVIGSGLSVNWKQFYTNIVDRFGTKELVLDDYAFRSQSAYTELAMSDKIINNAKNLSLLLLPDIGSIRNQPILHINIKSTGPEQNSFALALIVMLYKQQNEFYSKRNRDCIRISWQVKVFIDPDGFAKFQILTKFAQRILLVLPKWLNHLLEERIYVKDDEDVEDESKRPCMIDFFELKEVFEGILYCSNKANTLKTVITAI